MMAANYRHIGSVENRLGRHYSRFSASGPAATLAAQSLVRRKSRNGRSNRRSWVKHTLTEESIIVALVCIVFLLHVRSALVAILMLPVGVLVAMGLLDILGLSSNIMSLGGIAIALGAMVDAAIVMIENAHKHLERAAPGTSRAKIITDAALE